jgi:hypothetical protein
MSLKVKIDGDGSGFSATLDKLTKDAANFGNNLSSKVSGNFSQAIMGIVPGLTGAIAGVFSAGAIKSAISQFVEEGENIKIGSAKLNVDPETFQRIDRVMKEVHSDANSLDGVFEKVASSLETIKEGGPAAEKLRMNFAALGFAGTDLNDDYRALTMRMIEMNSGIDLGTEKIAAFRDVAGRSIDNVFPAMAIGGFNSNFAKAGTLSRADLDSLERANELMREISAHTHSWYNETMAGMVNGWRPCSFMAKLLPGGTEVARLEAAADAKANADKQAADKKAAQDAVTVASAKVLAIQAARENAAKKIAEEDAKKAGAIDKETAALEERNREAGMSPEERQLELQKQIAALKKETGAETKTAEAERLKHIAELEGELARLDRELDKPKHETHAAFRHSTSSLGNQAIGGIMLGHDSFKDLIKHAAATAKHTASIDKKTQPAMPARGSNRDYQ